MAANDNLQSQQEPFAVISGFSKIEMTDGLISSDAHGSEAAITVDQLYIMIRELKKLLDPATIDRLERLIKRHVAESNAHGITLPLLATNVTNEMYKEWLRYKNQTVHNSTLTESELMSRYSSEEFFKVLFQESRIADTPTVLLGLDGTKVVSPRGVNAYVQKHDTDIESHNGLMEFLFPGAVTEYTPTMSLVASLGIPAYMDIAAPDGILYMDNNGKMQKALAQALPVDWSTGIPAYPIFGNCTNVCPYGSVIDANVFTKNNVTVTTSVSESVVPGVAAFDINAVSTETSVDHTLEYVIDHSELGSAAFACISVFVKAKTLTYFAINTYTDVENPDTVYRYDLNSCSVFSLNGDVPNIHAVAYDSVNYVRCCYTVPIVDNTKDLHVVLRMLDILDGDFTYKGTDTDAVTVCGFQVEINRDTPSPYISTTGVKKSVAAVTPSIKLSRFGSSWYNTTQGSFMFNVTNIANIKSTLGSLSPRYVFDMKLLNSLVSAYAVYYPTVHNGRLTAYFATPTGSLGSTQMLSRVESMYMKAGVEFANYGCLQRSRNTIDINAGFQPAIFTVGNESKITTSKFDTVNNSVSINIEKLFIGCNCNGTNHLNGYLSELIYYPAYASEDHITFYTKG